MSNILGTHESLELLEQLKGAVQDFCARDKKLLRDYQQRTSAAQRQHETQLKELATRHAEELAAAENTGQQKKARARTVHEKRQTALNRAHKNSLKRALDQITQREDSRKFKLQRLLMEVQRTRDTDLANAEAAWQDTQRKQAETREAFGQLEYQAQKAFEGYGKFKRFLAGGMATPVIDLSWDEHKLLPEQYELHARTSEELTRFRRSLFPLFFKFFPLWLGVPVLGLLLGFLGVLYRQFQITAIPQSQAAVGLGAALALVLAGYFFGKQKNEPLARKIAAALEYARHLQEQCLARAAARHQQELQRLQNEFETRTREGNEQWQQNLAEAEQARAACPRKIEQKLARILARLGKLHQEILDRLEQEQAEIAAAIKTQAEIRNQELTGAFEASMARFKSDHDAQWQALESEWNRALAPAYERIARTRQAAAAAFPEWSSSLTENWTPPKEFVTAAQFGRLEVEVEKLTDGATKDSRLALPGPASFSLPLALKYPEQGSILLETAKSGSDEVAGALNNLILRLLAKSPPGKVSFTIIDPVRLGQNFAGVMHLSDYEENLVNRRIWTQTSEIEQQLADLNEHMEKVIQMYLRNEYATIAEYNEQAGNIAEKYHLLVIADFPVNFSDTAARRLINIAASGARCGVFTLIHWDLRQLMPQDFVPDELRKNTVRLSCGGGIATLPGRHPAGTRLVLDAPPPPEMATEFLHKVGQCSKDSNRVEVPFSHVAPPEAELWSKETTEELEVPIGRAGATKFQYLAIGKGTRQHALLAGKTGSGKSTLFHVVITNLSLWCSPEQVEFYLVDFKKGVEFKCYAAARLPHARVVAIESDREFGLSVLQRVDEELRRRGDLFRKLGVQDIPGFKRAGGNEPIPRCLLLIDEFQEFFVEDDRISQNAAVLLDRIVRQGRAFGIHVLLGSQTLGGAYTLARTTMGQMVIRIALQCNEADAYLIMDENNSAPRLLSRPGEGIYNDSAGAVEGNSPFQTVWLSDEERDQNLQKVQQIAARKNQTYPGPIVFEGNAPANVSENALFQSLLMTSPSAAPAEVRMWLGAPNSIKGPTEAVFRRQSGNNLVIVGQRDEAALAMLAISMLGTAGQHPRSAARILLLDSLPAGTPQNDFLERVVGAAPEQITRIKGGELAETLKGLAAEIKSRTDEAQSGSHPGTHLFIHGIQNFKKLKQDDDFSFSLSNGESGPNPAALLNTIISEGPSAGIHVIVVCDTFNNVMRYLGRKALSEFEMRVLFQMSANDSASLIDNPKASTLGLHRALFYNEQEGYLEVFRPYALPDNQWLEEVGRKLSQRQG